MGSILSSTNQSSAVNGHGNSETDQQGSSNASGNSSRNDETSDSEMAASNNTGDTDEDPSSSNPTDRRRRRTKRRRANSRGTSAASSLTADEGSDVNSNSNSSNNNENENSSNDDDETSQTKRSSKRRRLHQRPAVPKSIFQSATDAVGLWVNNRYLSCLERAIARRSQPSIGGNGSEDNNSNTANSNNGHCALNNFSESTYNQIIETLVVMLEFIQHTGDIQTLQRGWKILYLAQLQQDGPENQHNNTVENTHHIEAIVNTMSRNENNLKIQLLGCQALRSVIETEEDWNCMWMMDGVSVFLSALRNFPYDIVLQALGITYLALLVREGGDLPREEALQKDALELVLNAMRRFPTDPRLLHTASYAIHQLGFSDPAKQQLYQFHAVPIFMEAVQSFPRDMCLVDLCTSALAKLVDEANMGRHASLLPLILTTMETYRREEGIQIHCLVVLLRGYSYQRDSDYMERCITCIIQPMQVLQDSATIQFFSCANLRNVLHQSVSQNDHHGINCVMEQGGIEAALLATRKFPKLFGLQPMVLLLLMLIWDRQNHLPAATAFGGDDSILPYLAGVMQN